MWEVNRQNYIIMVKGKLSSLPLGNGGDSWWSKFVIHQIRFISLVLMEEKF